VVLTKRGPVRMGVRPVMAEGGGRLLAARVPHWSLRFEYFFPYLHYLITGQRPWAQPRNAPTLRPYARD
jgi:hypothetical protein